MATKKTTEPPTEYASAMDKIRDEMAKSKGNHVLYVQRVGEFLTEYLLEHPEAEAAIMAKGKSIAGSLAAMRQEAEKHKEGNMAVLDDRTAFGIVLGYFGIKGATAAAGTSSVTVEAPLPKPSPSGEGGTAQAVTEEVVSPDPFDLDALLGVM